MTTTNLRMANPGNTENTAHQGLHSSTSCQVSRTASNKKKAQVPAKLTKRQEAAKKAKAVVKHDVEVSKNLAKW
jgi:hypothetical protein